MWDFIQLAESCLSLATLFTSCTYFLCKVKCHMQRETYLTIAAIAICQLLRVTEDTISFAYPQDHSPLEHYSIYLFTASQFGYYSILLYYTYQMQITYDRVHEPQEDNLSEEEREAKRGVRKRKVRVMWGVMQVGLVISYALECLEKYYLKIKKMEQAEKYLSLSNRIMTLLTELPINLAQLFFMVHFIRLKMNLRRLTNCETVTLSLILSVVVLNILETILFNVV